jgi:hypothetical protein
MWLVNLNVLIHLCDLLNLIENIIHVSNWGELHGHRRVGSTQAWLILYDVRAAEEDNWNICNLGLLAHCTTIVSLAACLRRCYAWVLETVPRKSLLIQKWLPWGSSTGPNSRIVFSLNVWVASIALVIGLELLIWIWWLSLLNHPLIKEVLLFKVLRHLTVVLLIIYVTLVSRNLLLPLTADVDFIIVRAIIITKVILFYFLV